jgi:hypothetical protein
LSSDRLLVITDYVDDGWESWDDEWEGGYDAMFFKQLGALSYPFLTLL